MAGVLAVAEDPAPTPGRYRGHMPRHWIWMQIAIIVFTLAGMVIAITKLA